MSGVDEAARPGGPTPVWERAHVLVLGIGVSGFPAADALLRHGARVRAVDAGADERQQERAEILRVLGAEVRLGAVAQDPAVLEGVDLVVTSPGWRPDQPVLAAAAAAGIPVWGEVELAWRLRPAENAAPWLCLTGTNGKTTTVQMLAAMLAADGQRAIATGNVGFPLVDAVLADQPYDVLAVELSSYQLHWSHSLRPEAAAVLNLAPDHLDWHGGMDAYARAKGKVYENARIACVYNVADARTEQLVRDAEVEEGCRAIGFTLGVPAVSMLGVVDDVLVDRAFLPDRDRNAAELGSVRDVVPAAPHNVENALAAAALARAHGVRPGAVRDGLRGFRPDAHRIAEVATVDDVRWVDDSKATNTHAAAASLRAYESVVWVAGGLAKGAEFDDLVAAARPRLRAVVLIGRDRAQIAQALARHAPDVPVIEVAATETGAMDEVVRAAAELARAGDTVLLAPACASMDMFRDYGARGDAFADAVTRLVVQRSGA
ncbi:MAG TPA: UDP-N-acetylmuramoyl-L-alanine--D-glutamate ligase [Motilibacteraceae bacterium]|nr:UDP-N-acetylmuramoyl-L-alanine--D-glutamate ligase [Motilibacteraceae bacterium]